MSFPYKKSNLSKCLAATLLVANSVSADNDNPDKVKLDELNVWGTKVSSSSVVTLDGDSLEIKQADHISDLLRTLPGVDVGGAHSLNQRITIRSMDDKDLRIKIDGANQNTYMYHHMGNLQIHADILESADIEVGKNSVIHGGLGGSVNFKTKAAKDLLNGEQRWGSRIQGSYADNDSSGFSLTGYGQVTDVVDVLAYYNLVERKNYEVGGSEIQDANGDEIEGTDGSVRGLEGDISDALIKVGFDITDTQRIKLGFERYEDEGDYSYRPDMGLATDVAIANALAVDLTYPTEFTRDTYTLNYEGEFGHTFIDASIFLNESELYRDEKGLENWRPEFAGRVTGKADNSGMNVLLNTELGDNIIHDLKYGVEYIRYETDYYFDGYTSGELRSDEKATSLAYFIENRVEFGNGFSVTPGIRYDDYSIDSAVVDDDFSETTGALALEYALNNNMLFRVSQTQLFQGPEIGEVFVGAGSNDNANPDIKAETGENTEISIAFEDAVLGADNFSAGVTFFETVIDNYINERGSRFGTDKDNVGDMTIEGFETYVGYDLGGLAFLLSYSRAESDLDAFSEYDSLDGARIDRQQGDTISVSLNYHMRSKNLTLHWDMLNVDDVDQGLDLDGTASLDNSKDGFTVHNISAHWQPASVEGLTVIAGVDNLFDEEYASQSSRTGTSFHPLFGELYLQDYEPGRNIKLTLAYEF